jgi:dipeptidase E
LKLLLTSAGVTNPSIRAALVDLLGRPIEECTALVNSTASWPLRQGTQLAWSYLAGQQPENPMAELGWKSVGILELTALPSIPRSVWLPWVEQADALLVNGGDTIYLDRWMRESGLAELLPNLHETVYVGLSAGSMVLTPCIGEDFMVWEPPTREDDALGIVDFSIFPHLDHPDLAENTMAAAEKWAATLPNPAYAIDDDTAIRVVDGAVDLVTEGHWRLFPD